MLNKCVLLMKGIIWHLKMIKIIIWIKTNPSFPQTNSLSTLTTGNQRVTKSSWLVRSIFWVKNNIYVFDHLAADFPYIISVIKEIRNNWKILEQKMMEIRMGINLSQHWMICQWEILSRLKKGEIRTTDNVIWMWFKNKELLICIFKA